MDAMILAAGLGTRLRPLTHETPKPLIPVGGRAMIDHVADHLRAAGADRIVVNTHHLSDQVEAHVKGWEGVEVRISREEPEVLETGGGVLYAAPHFRGDAPFVVHNSDILSDIPIREMYAAHRQEASLATLAVMERETSRYLLFDDAGLYGWENVDSGEAVRTREPAGEEMRLAFTGVHVISPEFLGLVTERGAFPIFEPYLRLARAGHRIAPYRVDGRTWIDIGTHEDLARARDWMTQGSGSESAAG